MKPFNKICYMGMGLHIFLKPNKMEVKRSTSFSIIGRFGPLPYTGFGASLLYVKAYFLIHITLFLATGKVELRTFALNRAVQLFIDNLW